MILAAVAAGSCVYADKVTLEQTPPAVQQAIRQQLHDGRSQLLKSAYFEMLRDQAKVENYFAEQIFKNDAH